MMTLMPPGPLLIGLRIIAVAHLGALAMQPVLAGQYFGGGHPEAITLHGTVGETAAWLALGQGLMALLCWFHKALSPWGAAAFVAIFALDGVQVHVGHVKTLTVHVPLGAGLLAVSLAMTLWLWWRRAPEGVKRVRAR